MTDLRTITTQAIQDALAIRGLEDGGGGVIRSATPETYMDQPRLRLAREVLRYLPAGTTITGIASLVDKLSPVVSRAMQATKVAANPAGTVMFKS
jgi:hypothetical protein